MFYLGQIGTEPGAFYVMDRGCLDRRARRRQADLEPGDSLVAYPGGGGGIGDPLDRDVEKVRMGALNEYISVGTARDVYGVFVDPETFAVDEESTRRLREKMKEAKTTSC